MAAKTALITGAGDGIGRGIAIELAKHGYDLFLHSATNIEKAMELCGSLTAQYGCRTFCVQADLLCEDAQDRIFSEFDRHYPQLDLYVNNAGVTEGAPFLRMTRETVDRVVNINLKGAYFCTQYAAKRMVRQKRAGNIVILSSNQQDFLMPGMSIYGPVKCALTRLAKHISMELAEYGIRVNAIAPGYVDSSERMQPYRAESMRSIPLHRWATVSEIGKAVLYLDGEDASFITGACLVMDGGAVNKYFDMAAFRAEG